MNRFLSILVYWCAVSVLGAEVEDLTDANFDAKIKSGDAWFVKFYAPWCGHCKRLAPAWAKTADKLDGAVKVGAMDATKHTKIASEYDVTSFPKLKFFSGGKMYSYDGERTVEALEQFALHDWKQEPAEPMPGNSKIKVLDATNFHQTILSNDATVLLFYVKWCDHCRKLFPHYEQLAERLSGIMTIAKINAEEEQELSATWVSQGFPTIIFIGGGMTRHFLGNRDVDSLESWARALEEEARPTELQRVLNGFWSILTELKWKINVRGVDEVTMAAFAGGVCASFVLVVITSMFNGRPSQDVRSKKTD